MCKYTKKDAAKWLGCFLSSSHMSRHPPNFFRSSTRDGWQRGYRNSSWQSRWQTYRHFSRVEGYFPSCLMNIPRFSLAFIIIKWSFKFPSAPSPKKLVVVPVDIWWLHSILEGGCVAFLFLFFLGPTSTHVSSREVSLRVLLDTPLGCSGDSN